jgi:hypothetical protein
MTIQGTMVSVDSTSIDDVNTYVLKIIPGNPIECYSVYNKVTGFYDTICDVPSYEGQLVLSVDRASTDPVAVLYIAVNIATTGVQLKWIRCISSPNFFNPNTGAAFDPLAPHYNPLAS